MKDPSHLRDRWDCEHCLVSFTASELVADEAERHATPI